MSDDINTANDFFLGVGGGLGEYGFLIHPHHMTRDQAIRAAAWLVALADPMQQDFPAVLEAVKNL